MEKVDPRSFIGNESLVRKIAAGCVNGAFKRTARRN